jgi:hypothetical protein
LGCRQAGADGPELFGLGEGGEVGRRSIPGRFALVGGVEEIADGDVDYRPRAGRSDATGTMRGTASSPLLA